MPSTSKRAQNASPSGKAPHNSARLVQLQLGLAILLAVQAVAILVLSVANSRPLYVQHLTTDTLHTQISGVSTAAPAVSLLIHVNVAYVLATMMLLTAVVALALATVYRNRYKGMIKDTWQPVRWLTLAIAGAIMLALLALMVGVQDIMTLSLIKTLVLVACASGMMAEVMCLRRMGPEWLVRTASVVAVVAVAVPLLVVLSALLATNVFGNAMAPIYLWGLFTTVVIGSLLVITNAYLSLKKRSAWASYTYSEYCFIAIIALIETAFAWQIFAALLRP